MFKYILASLGALVASVLIVCLFAFPVDQSGVVLDVPDGIYSDYPINMEMKIDDGADSELSIVQKVTYNQNSHEYVYYIRVEYLYDDNEPIFFRWEVLDKLEAIGKDLLEQDPFMMELVPGDIKEFVYKSKFPPKLYPGKLTFMYKLYPEKKDDFKWVVEESEDPIMGPVPSEKESNEN
ncbi:MAG: hypothetical protein ACW99G_18240 [Candidatus Thorarchaeota archaeon]|jgi:hypothetical protein